MSKAAQDGRRVLVNFLNISMLTEVLAVVWKRFRPSRLRTAVNSRQFVVILEYYDRASRACTCRPSNSTTIELPITWRQCLDTLPYFMCTAPRHETGTSDKKEKDSSLRQCKISSIRSDNQTTALSFQR